MRSSECRVFQTEAKKSLIISSNIKKVSDAGGDKAKGRVWRRGQGRVQDQIKYSLTG